MSRTFDLEAPDHFTAGAIGPPGQRVFYLQAREAGQVLTLKCEKEQVSVLGEYLARLLGSRPGGRPAAAPGPDLLEPVEAAWAVGSLGVGFEQGRQRIVIEATELLEEGATGDPATARFRITREQAAAFVERTRALVRAGRPLCPVCSQPRDPAAHLCPRANGHPPAPA
jgi:uncharacterized repeat protein (TIGR03847 family)